MAPDMSETIMVFMSLVKTSTAMMGWNRLGSPVMITEMSCSHRGNAFLPCCRPN